MNARFHFSCIPHTGQPSPTGNWLDPKTFHEYTVVQSLVGSKLWSIMGIWLSAKLSRALSDCPNCVCVWTYEGRKLSNCFQNFHKIKTYIQELKSKGVNSLLIAKARPSAGTTCNCTGFPGGPRGPAASHWEIKKIQINYKYKYKYKHKHKY